MYGPIAKKAADLFAAGKKASDDEGKAISKELTELRPTNFPSVGPYKIDYSSVTEAQLTMVRNPGGVFADKVNFDKIVVYQGETAAVTPLVLSGDVDYATHGFPVATDKAFGDAGLRVLRGPLYTGPAIHFHWEKAAAFQDKRLRQAVAYAIDKEQSAQIAYGKSGKSSKFINKQKTSSGDVDFDALLNDAGAGFDVAKQKAPITKIALAFNELLPIIPLWERFNNNPVNDKKRVAGWKPDTDPIYQNGGGDNFIIVQLMDGTLSSI